MNKVKLWTNERPNTHQETWINNFPRDWNETVKLEVQRHLNIYDPHIWSSKLSYHIIIKYVENIGAPEH